MGTIESKDAQGREIRPIHFMILTPEQRASFEIAAKPLIKWLNENCHPHVSAHVESDRAELSEGVYNYPTSEFVPRD